MPGLLEMEVQSWLCCSNSMYSEAQPLAETALLLGPRIWCSIVSAAPLCLHRYVLTSAAAQTPLCNPCPTNGEAFRQHAGPPIPDALWAISCAAGVACCR